jgi:hypothetical protein
MLPIRISDHAQEQALERGATSEEILHAIRTGEWEPAKNNRLQSRSNFQFNQDWNGKPYRIKQVMAVFKELETEIIVVTVYTFYF